MNKSLHILNTTGLIVSGTLFPEVKEMGFSKTSIYHEGVR
jgi:hypothetical protein